MEVLRTNASAGRRLVSHHRAYKPKHIKHNAPVIGADLARIIVCAAVIIAALAVNRSTNEAVMTFRAGVTEVISENAGYESMLEGIGRLLAGDEGIYARVRGDISRWLGDITGKRPVPSEENSPSDDVLPVDDLPAVNLDDPAPGPFYDADPGPIEEGGPPDIPAMSPQDGAELNMNRRVNTETIVDAGELNLEIYYEDTADDTAPVPFSIPAPSIVNGEKVDIPFNYVLPVSGGVPSGFGYRDHPITGETAFHYGIDIGDCPVGTTVRAFAAGTVETAGYSSVYGNYVKIKHGGGFVSFYGHLSKYTVKKGQKVKAGDKIGAVGQTGMATGPHLHFELRHNDRILNPELYFA